MCTRSLSYGKNDINFLLLRYTNTNIVLVLHKFYANYAQNDVNLKTNVEEMKF